MKLYKNTLFLVGIIFAPVGGVFATIGVAVAMSLYLHGGNMTVNGVPTYYPPGTWSLGSTLFLSLFGGMGLLFLVLGLCLVVAAVKRRNAIKKLVDNGKYVNAKVIDVVQNRSVRVNGRYPYNIICQYDDGFGGRPVTFRSDNIMYHPGEVEGFYLKVYADSSNWDLYYVDIDSLSSSGGVSY